MCARRSSDLCAQGPVESAAAAAAAAATVPRRRGNNFSTLLFLPYETIPYGTLVHPLISLYIVDFVLQRIKLFLSMYCSIPGFLKCFMVYP